MRNDKTGVTLVILAALFAVVAYKFGIPATTLIIAAILALVGSFIVARKQRR